MRKIGVVIGSLLLAFAMLPSAFAAAGGPPATFTTINFGADEGNHCKNGQPDATTIVNCNIYEGKQYVWLNGGPENAALANGMYFFAVLVPGGQPDPNDGGAKNLSDTTAAPYGSGALNADGSAIPSGDARGNRTFEVSGGVVAYAGSHSFDSNKIRLMPYDDTTNEGGVYILAICKLSSDDAAVDPKDCKYDAFKVQTPEAPVTVQAVLSGTKYLDANTNGQMDPGETGLPNWTITISDGTTTSTASTDSAGDWSFTTPAVAEGTPETFTVSEVQQSGYAQTGNTVDQSSATGGVTVALSNKIYALTLPNTGPGSASGLNFGNIPLASALTASKSATPAFTRTFKWDISKDVDKTELDIAAGGSATFTYTVSVTHDAGADSGWNVSGNITVANSNSAAATIDSITDAINDGNAVCAVTGTFPATIAASDSSIFAYSCSYSAAPAASGQTNTATVAWSQQTLGNATLLVAGSATATADISWGAPTTIVDGSVSVSDALDSSSPRSFSYTDASPSTFTYSHTFTGDPAGTCTTHDNTATFTTNTSRTTGSASQTVKVCVGADLTVTKTATPTFTRTYNWNISKAVDKTLVKQVGGTATFNYTVVAAQTGFVDSAWAVSGTITVSNPNDWEAITATVTDAIDNGGTCTVTNGTNVSILAGGSVTFVYACTYTAAPNPLTGGTNTATAAWDKTTSATPNASATGSAAVSFTTPTSAVNKTITVTDTFNGGTPTTLGTLTATDGAPFTTRTFTYSHSISVPAFDCKSYTNTATIVETGQNASQTVTVCGPEKTGALTMGFWQNKNGQGIISGGASTAGVCNSATWLRQYAPFQDLSATATCAGVATYVSNVIKAASSAGDSMNPMLKGQMLATALDVYFSDAALGGNKIGAPGPIGGDSVDLTKICTNIPTCTTFVNSSSAFGGAASMTVSQILTYAASQSNAGGSTWYANLKSTQELAKDVFDAINNQVAFAP
jgi:hypothetical protein